MTAPATPVGTGAPTATQVVAGEHESLLRMAARRFRRHRLAMIGLVILVTIVAIALFLPFIVPLDPIKPSYDNLGMPPSANHLLGGDLSGRDIFARVVYGTRVSLIAGFGAVVVFVTIGTAIGLLAGAFGGMTDQVLMRVTDIILSIPPLLLIIVFISIVGPGLGSVIAVIGLVFWPQTARLVRGQLLSLREAEFVTASRVIGVKERSIVGRHMIPNIFGPLTVVATFGVASAILLEAALSFLGLGVQPPTPSLGEMISAARAPAVLQNQPWVWLPAGVVIALIVMSVNFVGDGLRDALDPRATRRG
ncbi:MAG: ABC transporter permease [Chloroflexota bacterium]